MENDNKPNAPRQPTKQEVQNELLRITSEELQTVKESLDTLKHGEKHRLLECMLYYPMEDISFPDEPSLNLIAAAMKRQIDAKVGLAVEIVIDSLRQDQLNAQQLKTEGESNESN